MTDGQDPVLTNGKVVAAMSRALNVRRDGAVAFLELQRGPLNLLSVELRSDLCHTALEIGADTAVRAVVIRSISDRAFSAGSDVNRFPADPAAGVALASFEQACFNAIAQMPQPVVAELRGHVLVGGLELALACDIRLAEDSAGLALPEAGLGVFPTGGGTQRLSRLLGPSRAKLFMILGEAMTASEALDIGLVDYVVGAGQASTATHALAMRIAERPRRAVQAIKAAVDHGTDFGRTAGLAKEQELAVVCSDPQTLGRESAPSLSHALPHSVIPRDSPQPPSSKENREYPLAQIPRGRRA